MSLADSYGEPRRPPAQTGQTEDANIVALPVAHPAPPTGRRFFFSSDPARVLRPVRRLLLGAATPLVLFALWIWASQTNQVPALILPAPGTIYEAFISLWESGDLTANLSISMQRVIFGFAAGAGLGLALGAGMGLSPRLDRFLRPSFLAIAQIPVLAWIPFLMIVFGIGEALKIVIIAKASFVPVTLNTLDGFRNIPKAYIEVARIYRFNRRQILAYILLPGALLPIFTGLRYGLTHAWQSLVVVELLASTEGLGYQMVMARQLFQLDVMIATMIVIGIIGFALDKFLARSESLLARRYGAAA